MRGTGALPRGILRHRRLRLGRAVSKNYGREKEEKDLKKRVVRQLSVHERKGGKGVRRGFRVPGGSKTGPISRECEQVKHERTRDYPSYALEYATNTRK